MDCSSVAGQVLPDIAENESRTPWIFFCILGWIFFMICVGIHWSCIFRYKLLLWNLRWLILASYSLNLYLLLAASILLLVLLFMLIIP